MINLLKTIKKKIKTKTEALKMKNLKKDIDKMNKVKTEKCSFDKTLLSYYIDNETSYKDDLLVQNHINRCMGCRRGVMELSKVANIFKECEPVEVSSGYDRRFKQKFNKKIKTK